MRNLRQIVKFQALFVVLLLCGTDVSAQTQNITPYAQADTSSPRATLQTFLETLDQGFALDLEATLSYLSSDRLYPNEVENRLWEENDRFFLRGLETIDFSGLPSGFIDALAVEKIVLLAEILSRIDIPPVEDVPTHEVMKASGETSWRIPNSRIEIALITEGPREGEYLFSARTVLRLEEFHDVLAALPYKPGPTQRYVNALRPYTAAATLYDIYSGSFNGFGILPDRWLFNMPTWLNAQMFGMSVWKWLPLLLFVFMGYLFVSLTWSIGRRMGSPPQWRLFNAAIVTCVFAWLMIPVCAQFHINGNILHVLGITSVVVLYLVGAWAAFIGSGAIAETVINFQSLRQGSIDGQLIRLGVRLIGMVIAVGLLIEGADKLGLPSYSVIAGIGVSGLAFAFAARETLANLLGSIVILLEKPFRRGHWIKVGDAEGTVEYIGFRSTRIRTFGDSLISIPNGTVVNSVVDNLGVRSKRQQRFNVHVSYDTPREKVKTLVDGIRRIVSDHPMTDKDVSHIYLNEFGENSLDILLYFYLRVADFDMELREREGILLQILELGEELGVAFISPRKATDRGDPEESLRTEIKSKIAIPATNRT
jgi:MscS family membrane protein